MLIGLSDEPPEILLLSPYKEGLLWFSRDETLEKVPARTVDALQSDALPHVERHDCKARSWAG